MTTFEDYYAHYFKERWDSLKPALLAPHWAFPLKTGTPLPYYMDTGSVLAGFMLAEALALYGGTCNTHDNFQTSSLALLDACSAPGGKALALAYELTRRNISFTLLANELSSNRRRRLKEVLDTYCDTRVRSAIIVSGFDAARAGSKKTEHNRFNGIMLDVPCSSERHVLTDAKAYAEWTPARIKNLSQRQWSLLSSAYLLAREHAVIAYITCALTETENDAVIARALKKHYNKLKIIPAHEIAKKIIDEERLIQAQHESSTKTTPLHNNYTAIQFETTAYGIAILPDVSHGAGPLYISLLLKQEIMS